MWNAVHRREVPRVCQMLESSSAQHLQHQVFSHVGNQLFAEVLEAVING